MKRVSNLYKKICDINVIMDMYDNNIRLNTKNKRKIQIFDNFYSCNIINIKETLISKNYKPGKYNIFLVREPKLRIIMSQEIKDKIINHLVAKYFLVDIFDKTLIDSNCATRIGKGTHYALRQFKNYYNYYKNKYNDFYILKLDISKYFYNLDHQIIKNLVKKKIKDKDVLSLINVIIDSTNEEYINKEINLLKKIEISKIKKSNYHNMNKKIKEIEDLPFYQKGKGCCIGNMVSQIIATFYLDEMDKFIKEKLKIKAYGRYMDDFYIMHEDKEYLKYCLSEIKKVIDKYKLRLNKKTKIYTSGENIEFLGFMFINKKNIVMKLSNKTKKNFKIKMIDLNNRYEIKELSYNDYRSVRDSYKGHLSYGSCHNLYDKYVHFKN